MCQNRYNLRVMKRKLYNFIGFVILLISIYGLVSCSNGTLTPTKVIPSDTPLVSPSPTITPTPLPPSPTPIPLVALVNDEPITEAEFQSELERFSIIQEGTAPQYDENPEQIVLDDLINQVLFVQAANEAGFFVDEDLIDERWEKLADELGSEQVLISWLEENEYTIESFRHALARSIAIAWMRDQIIEGVPEISEQVHARQILLYNLEQAQEVLTDLESGNDFATLATTFDPVTSGDMGWFPRGFLAYAQLEEAVFDLQPLEYSGIVETPLGFHILQLIERESDRLLEPEARLVLQTNALHNWLQTRRDESEITIYLPES